MINANHLENTFIDTGISDGVLDLEGNINCMESMKSQIKFLMEVSAMILKILGFLLLAFLVLLMWLATWVWNAFLWAKQLWTAGMNVIITLLGILSGNLRADGSHIGFVCSSKKSGIKQ